MTARRRTTAADRISATAGPVVVTGGAGFIGSHVVRALAHRGAEVVVVDSLRHGLRDAAVYRAPNVSLRRADVRDRRALRGALPSAVGAVVHLAALHYVPYCIEHPDETLDVNVGGTETLLSVLAERSHEAVIMASSAAVYGFSDTPADEQSRLAPTTVYGESKLRSEDLLLRHCAACPSVRGVAARLFNVYGPGETNRHVIPEILERLGRGGSLRLGNVWPQRDYVHVKDVVRALLALMSMCAATPRPPIASRRPAQEVAVAVNVCTGVGTTVEQLVDVARGATGDELPIVIEQDRRRADDGHLVGRHEFLTSLTGWQPTIDVSQGLTALVGEQFPAGRVRLP